MSDATEGHRVARNTVLLFAVRVGVLAITFALTLAVAWRLGSEALGDYGLMVGYWFVSQQVAALGLGHLLPREIAQRPRDTRILVLAGMAIAVPAGCLAGFGLFGLAAALDYDPLRRTLIDLVAVALLPGAITQVGETVLLAQERGGALAAVQAGEHVLRGLVSLVVLFAGYGLIGLGCTLVATRVIGMLMTLALLRGRVGEASARRLGEVVARLLRALPIYAALYAAAAVFLRIDLVVLSKLADKSALGYYTAAFRLYDAAAMLPATATLVVYPVLARLWATDRGQEAVLASRSIANVWIACIPFVLGLSLGAPGIVGFLYSDEFAPSVAVLAILAWGLIPTTVEKLLGHTMVAGERQVTNLLMVVAAAAFGGALHVMLVPRMGPVGSACGTVGALMFLAAINAIYVQRKMFPIRLGSDLARILPAALACGAFLYAFGDRGPWWTIPVAFGIYGAVGRLTGGIRADFLATLTARRERDEAG